MFTPDNWPGKEYVTLKVEEVEAMRLADFEGRSQDEAATLMHISRQTFQRLLYAVRARYSCFDIEYQGII